MQKLQYKIDISTSAEKVFRTMLDLETYQQWTAAFSPTSSYEGSWEKGSKILFTGTDENGKKGGMVSEIIENIPNKLVSIRHYGMLDGDNEITEGELVEKWAGSIESYSFEENGGITTVFISVDTAEEYVDFFNEAWEKALNILKALAEK